jgi:hypothetical protein
MGNCIAFFYFLSFLDLFSMCAQCRACFCGETCFNHEGVLVLLCLNVFLNTLLADVFLEYSLNALDVTSVAGTQVR